MNEDPAHDAFYRLDLAYKGTAYRGFQRQPGDAPTVQSVVEDTLRRLFRDPELHLVTGSRTDAGVHALCLTTSFRTPEARDPDEIAALLSHQLPHDIRALSLRLMPPGTTFNAHEQSCGKSYLYAVNPGDYHLFQKETCWGWPGVTDLSEIRRLFPLVAGTHDFSAFTSPRAAAAGIPVRTVWRAEMRQFGPVVCFYLAGNGFLYNMIRRIVGAMYSVASGALSPADFRNRLEHPFFDPDSCVAPPHGLFLKKIFFRPGEWETDPFDRPPFLG